jgi:hypothetical protein
MKKFALSLAVLGLSATAAFAQTPSTFADVDADGSGELSFVELQTAWPDLTEAELNTGDTDASGGLSVSELNVMQAVMSTTPDAAPPTSAPAVPEAVEAPPLAP